MTATVLLFLLGLAALYKGGDIFVEEAVYIARRFRIPEIIIGATIVSIGTTLPEMTVSALASANGLSSMAYGNAIGSVSCNAALIAGVLLLLAPSHVAKKEIMLGTIFFFAAALFFTIAGAANGSITVLAGLILLAVYAAFVVMSIRQSSKTLVTGHAGKAEAGKEGSVLSHLFFFVVGGVLVFFGSKLLIDNGVLIAQFLKVPERIIALTFIALGTSLPELVTAIASISKGHGDISLGNIIGANLMNISVVIGISSLIHPVAVPQAELRTDLLFAFVPMLLLAIPTLLRSKTSRMQGGLLLCAYIWYCILLFHELQYASAFLPYISYWR